MKVDIERTDSAVYYRCEIDGVYVQIAVPISWDSTELTSEEIQTIFRKASGVPVGKVATGRLGKFPILIDHSAPEALGVYFHHDAASADAHLEILAKVGLVDDLDAPLPGAPAPTPTTLPDATGDSTGLAPARTPGWTSAARKVSSAVN